MTKLTPDRRLLVKVRWPGERAWYFATPKGGATRLRVHAAQCTEAEADRTVALIQEHDATLAIRVQTWDGKVVRTIHPKQKAA